MFVSVEDSNNIDMVRGACLQVNLAHGVAKVLKHEMRKRPRETGWWELRQFI